jgi:hypothetical protein
MIEFSLAVVPAKAGTHTAESLGGMKMADDLRSNEVLSLWVPAFAGTTVRRLLP